MNPSNFNVPASAARYWLAVFVLFWRVSAAHGEAGLVSISGDGNGLEIKCIGVLQSADSAAGPWVDELGETPMKVIPSGRARYYRAKPFELPATARFNVNLETGEVGVFPGSTVSGQGLHAAAVFGGSTIGFNSSVVLTQAGNPGEKVLSVSLVNQSGRTVGEQPNGVLAGITVLFDKFQNLSTPSDLRLQATVSTLAGSGASGTNDGPALSATFLKPSGVAVGPDGTVYICDAVAHRIRKLSQNQVFTLAGSGNPASVDGIGTAASFNFPWGIAYSPQANGIVIAERNGRRIRLLTLDGVLTTVAGTGALGSGNGAGNVATFDEPIAVAVDGTGAIYVAEYNGRKIRKITLTGPNPRLASSYTVSTWAGSGVPGSLDGVGASAQFGAILELAAEPNGTLYVADEFKIRRVSPAQEVVTIAGTGAPGSVDGNGKVAQFKSPAGIDLLNGSLAVSDYVDHKVRLLTLTPGGTAQNAADWQVRTLAGTGVSGATDGRGDVVQFFNPFSVAADGAGNLIVADYSNSRLRRLAPTAGYFPVGTPAPTTVTEPVRLSNAKGVYTFTTAAAQTYRPYISYNESLLPGATSVPQKWAFVVPAGVNGFEFNVTVVAPSDTQVPLPAVSNPGGTGGGSPDVLVTTLAGTGIPGYLNGPAAGAQFKEAKGIAVDREGNVYVADSSNNAIRRISNDRIVTTVAGGLSGSPGSIDGRGDLARFKFPVGIAVTPDGETLYVTDYGNSTIRRIVSNGGDPKLPGTWSVATIAGVPLASGYVDNTDGATARFVSVSGIAWGPGDVLIVADEARNTIRRLQPQGDNLQLPGSWYVSLVAGDPAGGAGMVDGQGSVARFNVPAGVAVDQAGVIYVTDFFNFRVRKIDLIGNVTTLAGSSNGYTDGIGTAAHFGFLYGITVDSAGYVYVSERDNSRIRRVSPVGIVTTVTGAVSPTGYDGTGDAVTALYPWGLAIDNAGTLYASSGAFLPIAGPFVDPGVRIRMIQRILR